jgi:hypothetical protein
VTLQTQERCCHTCSPFPGATKNGTSMYVARTRLLFEALATAGRVQPHHDRPLRASDKPARAAIFSFIMVRRRRCSTPMHEARHRPFRRNFREPAYCETARAGA